MSLRPQEIVRSEVEGGLSGPANSLTAESIDCGCAHYRLPGLVKFATRRIFLVLLCSIGFLQAAVQAYFHVTSNTIARRFQIDPFIMGWVLYVSDITPVLFGLVVAFWGDRIHRAAWLGGLALVQCAGLVACVIPHIAHWTQKVEDTGEVTHMSIYADESPELCSPMTSMKLISKENVPRYSTLLILIIMQIVSGTAHIGYYALGISYLDDNTKKVHVSVYLGGVVAVKALGSLLGYILGWAYLRIDADDFSSIKSYSDQIGAWWLGWPIFALLLAIPSVCMAIFPRKLPSEMVQQAAATILDQSGTFRGSQRISAKKVGSTFFIPSMLRLISNKILICNVLGAAFLMTALINFSANENIFLESRFYAPRPTGMLVGFNDPLLSRLITIITRPILIGLAIIIAGLVIGRAKPKARTLVTYSLAVLVASALIIFALAFNDCDKAPISGASHRGSMSLTRYCNKNCRCSRDADFRPICDSRGTYTYYSPCHAGCTTVEDSHNNRLYFNCSCVEDMTGQGNNDAREGPCGSDTCQIGWLIYEVVTMLVYAAISSTIIGDLLVCLRSINVQDKALTIGYGLTLLGFLAYVPGKIGYDQLVKSTCQYWGSNNNFCHLHSSNLATYLCFLTAGLILISALLKVGAWLFCADLEMYDPSEDEEVEQQQPREMTEMSKTQAEPLLQARSAPQTEEPNNDDRAAGGLVDSSVDPDAIDNPLGKANGPVASVQDEGGSSGKLKYGPLGPGDRRTDRHQSSANLAVQPNTDDDLDSSDGSQGRSKHSLISYKPLNLDSDAESELSSTTPARSRKARTNSSLDELSKPPQRIQPLGAKRFPNPDNYDDPRLARSSRHNSPQPVAEDDGSSRTNSFEYSKRRKDEPLSASRGDFNEIGIPLVDSYETTIRGSTNSLRSPTIMIAMQQLDDNVKRVEALEHAVAGKSARKSYYEEMEENRKYRLEKLMQPVDYSPVAIRPPSRGQASSSGFGSLQDLRERVRSRDVSDSRDSLSSKSSEPDAPPKKDAIG